MPWRDTGTHFYRSWPIAESAATLDARWDVLAQAVPPARAGLLKESRDRKATKTYRDLWTGQPLPTIEALPKGAQPPPAKRLSFRSFDRQWCYVDNRVGDYLRPQLWHVSGQRQVEPDPLFRTP